MKMYFYALVWVIIAAEECARILAVPFDCKSITFHFSSEKPSLTLAHHKSQHSPAVTGKYRHYCVDYCRRQLPPLTALQSTGKRKNLLRYGCKKDIFSDGKEIGLYSKSIVCLEYKCHKYLICKNHEITNFIDKMVCNQAVNIWIIKKFSQGSV